MIRLFETRANEDEIAVVADVMRSGRFVLGDYVAAFEARIGDYLGVDRHNVVTCNSGTDALILAIGELTTEGAEVIVPAMTFSATFEAVIRAGRAPVIVDVDPKTMTLSLETLKRAVSPETQAVIVVHLYGWPAAEIEAIRAWCDEEQIALIEDVAQAFGAVAGEKTVGTFGDAAAFSFYPTKPLGGIGDGGAVVFKERELAYFARAERNHGREKDRQTFPGFNSRLDEVNAAVLGLRIENYGRTLPRLWNLAGTYAANLPRYGGLALRGTPAPYVYPVLVEDRAEVMRRLKAAEIECGIHYRPVSQLSYVRGGRSACPGAAHAAPRILSLPCHRGMTEEDVLKVCDAVGGAG